MDFRDHPSTWRPEYAAYMVEGTPGKPYGGLMAHFNVVESNMSLRYVCIDENLFSVLLIVNFIIGSLYVKPIESVTIHFTTVGIF